MAQTQIQELGEQHRKILDLLLHEYTGKNLGQLAKKVGYTQSWLSTVINSDAFKAEYRARREGINELQDGMISQKAQDVANKALDRLSVIMESDDGLELKPEFYLTAATKVMQTLGYGQGGKNIQQEVTGGVIPIEEEVITLARRKIIHKAEATL